MPVLVLALLAAATLLTGIVVLSALVAAIAHWARPIARRAWRKARAAAQRGDRPVMLGQVAILAGLAVFTLPAMLVIVPARGVVLMRERIHGSEREREAAARMIREWLEAQPRR